jgi:hypothetical protein
VDDMPKKLHRNNEFTSFAIIYPDISKALQDSANTEMTSAGIEHQYEIVKQFTEKLTNIFKKEDEDENKG